MLPNRELWNHILIVTEIHNSIVTVSPSFPSGKIWRVKNFFHESLMICTHFWPALTDSRTDFLWCFHFFCQSSKKDDASEGAGDTGSPEKADAEGSSDEDEGALVIDEKSEKGGNKRKVEESTEVRFSHTHTHTVFGMIGAWGGAFLTIQMRSGVSQTAEGFRGGRWL